MVDEVANKPSPSPAPERPSTLTFAFVMVALLASCAAVLIGVFKGSTGTPEAVALLTGAGATLFGLIRVQATKGGPP